LLRNSDYTTNGATSTVTLTSGAAVGDIVEVVTVTNLNSINTATTTTNTFTGNQIINANLGIGTSSLTAAGGYGSITIDGSNGSLWSAKVAGTETFRIQPTAASTVINGIANLPMIFQTNSTERMRILATGEVCIGTASAAGLVHIRKDSGAGDGYTTKFVLQ
jgi:hypothetical protein